MSRNLTKMSPEQLHLVFFSVTQRGEMTPCRCEASVINAALGPILNFPFVLAVILRM